MRNFIRTLLALMTGQYFRFYVAGYSNNDQPVCTSGPLTRAANRPKTWTYASVDAESVVRVDGYITDGQDLGMSVGDFVYVTDTDASPVIVTVHRVVSLSSSDRSVDLSNGDTLVTGTDSD